MAYVTFSTIMCIIGYQCPYIVIQFGWLVSYVWLRFYKKNTETLGGPAYGDRSETFAFVNWFPPLIQSVLIFCPYDKDLLMTVTLSADPFLPSVILCTLSRPNSA